MPTHGKCIWLCGAPGSGKSTIAAGLAQELRRRGRPVEVLDESPHAEHLVLRLDPSAPASDADLRRLAHVAGLLAQHGAIAIVAADAGADLLRESIRTTTTGFVEVFADAPLHVCEERRPEPRSTRPFEPPVAPDVRVITADRTPDASVAQLVSYLESIGTVA